jgi:hypothetical protein
MHNLDSFFKKKFRENTAKFAAVVTLHNLGYTKVAQPVLELPLDSLCGLIDDGVQHGELAEVVLNV